MVKIRIAKTAEIDIKNIYKYVLKQSYQNAELLRESIFDAIDSLRQFPERGHVVTELQNPLFREIKVFKFRIIYRCQGEDVIILTILHSSRLLINSSLFDSYLE
jgi:plasmid stabilization system protein ParE